jgi:hypothetical protein
MKIYVPWQTGDQIGDCQVESVWMDFFTHTWNIDFYYNYYKSNPNYRNVEKVDGKIKYELLVTKYYIEVTTLEELLSILTYYKMFNPETNSLTFEED